MIDSLKSYLLENWERIGLNDRPKELSFIEIGGMRNFPGKVLFLIFAQGCKTPVLLAKVSRFQEDSTMLEREYENLQYVNTACVDEAVKMAIPIPIFYEPVAEHAVLLTRAFDGVGISRFYLSDLFFPRKMIKARCRRSSDWLARFHKAVRITRPFSEREFHEEVKEPIESFRAIFGASEEEERFFRIMEDAGRRSLGKEGLLFFRHGDLSPGNIFLAKDGIKVTDWEYSRKQGLPLHDLLFFFIRYGLEVFRAGPRGKDVLAKFEMSFFQDNWYSRLVKECTIRYCRQLTIDLSLIKFSFFMLLLTMADSEYRELRRNRDSGYMAVAKGYSKPIDAVSDLVTKDGLYINMLKLFIKREDRFILDQGEKSC